MPRANEADTFEFACYDAIMKLGKPASAKDVAVAMNRPSREVEVRKVLVRLHQQKALSRVKVRGAWHYFV